VAEARTSQRAARTVAGGRLGEQPVLTYVLIGINLLVFLVTALQANSGVEMSPSSVFRNGVLSPTFVASGQWWRLLTSGFLHLSVIHVGLNMMSLYFLGVPLERMLGRIRFLAVYLLALLGGSAAVVLLTGELSLVAGASGAIFGLMGGLLVVFKRFRYDMRQLLFVLVINLFVSFRLPGISWQAHLGGLIVGALVTAAMVYPPQVLRTRVQIGTVVLVLGVLALLVIYRDSQIVVRCTGMDAINYLGCREVT